MELPAGGPSPPAAGEGSGPLFPHAGRHTELSQDVSVKMNWQPGGSLKLVLSRETATGGSGKRSLRSLPMVFRRIGEPSASLRLPLPPILNALKSSQTRQDVEDGVRTCRAERIAVPSSGCGVRGFRR